jgi:hypothetical protein
MRPVTACPSIGHPRLLARPRRHQSPVTTYRSHFLIDSVSIRNGPNSLLLNKTRVSNREKKGISRMGVSQKRQASAKASRSRFLIDTEAIRNRRKSTNFSRSRFLIDTKKPSFANVFQQSQITTHQSRFSRHSCYNDRLGRIAGKGTSQ